VAKPPRYKPRLIVFDVEGVLIPRNRFFFLLGKALGFAQLIRVFFYGFLYETGLIPLKSAMKNLFRGARGITVETLMQIVSKVPIVPGARAVFDQLKAQGYKTALITSGLPTLIAKLVAEKLGADYAFGFEAEINGNKFTGEIWGDVLEQNGKLAVLQRIVKDEQLEFSDCAVVADDRNNASIFLRDMLKIAYNPDFVLRIKADNVVTGNISKILSVINGEPKRRGKPSWNDVFRELIHASGVFIPVIAGVVGVPLVAVSIILVLGVYATSEYLRTEGKKMPLINFITRKAASQNELYQIVLAPVYFAIGILITLVIFPAPASSAAIAIFALGDSTASIFGRYLAKTPLPFNNDKSLEGSAAGFFFALLAGSFFVSPLVALVGAAIAMFVEYLPLPINDNLLIPLITGLAMTFLA
jgi:HAD superfamily phosphoserine phosphatase-like hydrolase